MANYSERAVVVLTVERLGFSGEEVRTQAIALARFYFCLGP
jgi:hypothetical protein